MSQSLRINYFYFFKAAFMQEKKVSLNFNLLRLLVI